MKAETNKDLYDRVMHNEATDCLEWKGAVDTKGYPIARVLGKTTRVTRLMYKLTHPNENIRGLVVCHACDNPSCINENHLFIGTLEDNAEDCKQKGKLLGIKRSYNPKRYADKVHWVGDILSGYIVRPTTYSDLTDNE